MIPRKWNVRIEKSKRKTLYLTVQEGNEVCVKTPLWYPDREIYRFLEQKKGWIEKQMERIARESKRLEEDGALTAAELKALAELATKVIPQKVAYYARILGVSYGRITIRNQRSRWGSCSSEGNLNFNCLLMLAPSEVVDYVVVHELCHRLEMNHSARFWAHVESVLPDYRERRRWLKDEGLILMRRMVSHSS